MMSRKNTLLRLGALSGIPASARDMNFKAAS